MEGFSWVLWLAVGLLAYILGVVIGVTFVLEHIVGRRKAYKYFQVVTFPRTLYEKAAKERALRKMWEEQRSAQETAAERLLKYYRILIPQSLLDSIRGNRHDREGVRVLADPMLFVFAIATEEAANALSALQVKQKKGEPVEDLVISRAEASFHAAQRRLYALWDLLYVCGVYPGIDLKPGFKAILNITRK